MNDDHDPEEKPSFFDPADEAVSWPPSDDYELEESEPDTGSGAAFFGVEEDAPAEETQNLETNFSDSPEMHSDGNIESSETIADEPDAFDELFGDDTDAFMSSPQASIEEANVVDAEADDIILTPAPSQQPEEDTVVQAVPEQAYDDADEVLIAQEPSLIEPVVIEEDDDEIPIYNQDLMMDSGEIVQEDHIDEDDDDVDEIVLGASSTPGSSEETIDEIFNGRGPGTEGDHRLKEELISNMVESKPPVVVVDDSPGMSDTSTSDRSQEVYEETPEEEEDIPFEDLKPFRSFSKIDYDEITGAVDIDDEDEDEEGGILANIDRNVLIVIGVALILLVYFLFTSVFNRTYETKSRRRTRPPKKEKRVRVQDKELIPIWEVAPQKGKSYREELNLVRTIYKGAGRDNPFSMPESVLKDLREAAEIALLKKRKPDMYKRLAYRATLVGVLTSQDSTIALIDMQEASFDVLEKTEKKKILKLATKTMDKSKRNTLEMVAGSYIGPWQIIEIVAPEGAFKDAKLTVQYKDMKKILNMGKAEELGIFTEGGIMDNLEEPIGGKLDHPDDEIFWSDNEYDE